MKTGKYLLPFQVKGIEMLIDRTTVNDSKVRKDHTRTTDSAPFFSMQGLTEGVDVDYLFQINRNRQILKQLKDIMYDAKIVTEYNSYVIDYGTLFQATISDTLVNGAVKEEWYMLLNIREGIEYLSENTRSHIITDDAKLGRIVKGLCAGQRYDFFNPKGELIEGVITKIATEEDAKRFLEGIMPTSDKVYEKQ